MLSLGSILWGPWISNQNTMWAHLLLVEIFQSTVDNQPTSRPSIIIHFDAVSAKLTYSVILSGVDSGLRMSEANDMINIWRLKWHNPRLISAKHGWSHFNWALMRVWTRVTCPTVVDYHTKRKSCLTLVLLLVFDMKIDKSLIYWLMWLVQ